MRRPLSPFPILNTAHLLPRLGIRFPTVQRFVVPPLAIPNIWRQYAGGLAPIFKVGRELELFSGRHKPLRRAGWLPHYTTPYAEIEGLQDPDEIDRTVADYYRANWPSVRAALVEHIAGYGLAADPGPAMEEALRGHELGLFRCAPLLLYAEVERVARAEIEHDNPKRMASQPELRRRAGDLCLSDFKPSGSAGYMLFEALVDHAYRPAETVEEIEQCQGDPVPNRHAAMHGRVVYDTHRSSMNMLILADYLFQVIRLVKSRSEQAPS